MISGWTRSGALRVIGVMLLFAWSGAIAQKTPDGPATDDEGSSDSPLIRAIVEGNETRARQLVEGGASPNQKDRFGGTPLGVAVTTQHSDLAEFLVKRGADVNLTEARSESPLMAAASVCDVRMARFLLEHGARADHKDDGGGTPLSIAAHTCQDGDMVRLLVAYQGKVSSSDTFGNTPLTVAAFNGNEPVTRELIRAGADLSAKNREGKTAEDIALSLIHI